MLRVEVSSRLYRPVDDTDHIFGNRDAEITLVEYGSYDCSHCRAANDEIARVRENLGDRVRYVFRHLPLMGNDLALRAAEIAECADDDDQFWHVHFKLMTRSVSLSEEDISVVSQDLGLHSLAPQEAEARSARAKRRVDSDVESAFASGVQFTPTFFINDRRYDGTWDESSLSDALLGRLGHRVQSVAFGFASWGPSSGVLLLLATALAILLSNSSLSAQYETLLHTYLGFTFGSLAFQMSLQHWINDGLLTIFFLVVGLEIKREMTVGRLASMNTATLPIVAAIGGMVAPALIYWAIVPAGPWTHGWGIPMATDTAFVVALIVMMGSRVPIELRVFLTAAAIVDDIGSIVVVALFYSEELQWAFIVASLAVTLLLGAFNRARVYRVSMYLLLGVLLWVCVYASGLHASLAGIILAMMIPTRQPANLKTLVAQADTIIAAEAQTQADGNHSPSLSVLQALDAIHERIEPPADRLLRHAAIRTSYLILPIFALANAGVELGSGIWEGHNTLMMAVAAGLVAGKPLGILLACFAAIKLGFAAKPASYSWQQLAGAASLAGIGFTMSLFIAGQAMPNPNDFAAVKVAVFGASLMAALVGVTLFLTARQETSRRASGVSASEPLPVAEV